MDELKFLQKIFQGYVNCYSSFRWHTGCTYSDMTSRELGFFTDLGIKLGFIVIREYTDRSPHGHEDKSNSNPRDLVWIDPDTCDPVPNTSWGNPNNGKVFLHLERENSSKDAICAGCDKLNKLSHAANCNDGRYLIGVFGWVTEGDKAKIISRIKSGCEYKDRNVLIISFTGETQEKADSLEGYVFANGKHLMRKAVTGIDGAGYWYAYLEKLEKRPEWDPC